MLTIAGGIILALVLIVVLFVLAALALKVGGWAADRRQEFRNRQWIRRQADRGDPYNQFELGLIYKHGQRSVAQNLVQAYMWFELSALRSAPGAHHNRAVQWRDNLTAMMTPAQIAEAQRLAREWQPPSSDE